MDRSKKLALTLAGSVALNLFFVGGVVAHRMHHKHHKHHQGAGECHHAASGAHGPKRSQPADHQPGAHMQRSPHQEGGPHHMQRGPHQKGGPPPDDGAGGPPERALLRDLVKALGGPKDPRVKQSLREIREVRSQTRKTLGEAKDKLRAAISAKERDEAAIAAALAELNQATDDARNRGQAALIRLSAELTAEERAALSSR